MSSTAPGNGTQTGLAPDDTRSLGEIVGDISRDLGALMHQELELAKTELKQEMSRAGKGAGILGGAGLAGYFTLFFVSLALAYGLGDWWGDKWWLGALVTAALWGIAAAVLALRGKKEITKANPQLPKTQESLKEDVQWAKAQKS
jgi:Putative Actinobacterial Holin-X, holin superfamily III